MFLSFFQGFVSEYHPPGGHGLTRKFRGFWKRVVFQKGGFGGCSAGNENRNEGAFGCSAPKKRNEGACGCPPVPKKTERGHIRQNRPFVSSRKCSKDGSRLSQGRFSTKGSFGWRFYSGIQQQTAGLSQGRAPNCGPVCPRDGSCLSRTPSRQKCL